MTCICENCKSKDTLDTIAKIVRETVDGCYYARTPDEVTQIGLTAVSRIIIICRDLELGFDEDDATDATWLANVEPEGLA